jgi:hypothetical protein
MHDRTWRDRARLGFLAIVAFILAHDIAFLLTYGGSWQALLARTGHGEGWTDTVIAVTGIALALGAAGIARLSQLARLARRLEAGPEVTAGADMSALAAGLRQSWLVIFPVSIALFLVVENVERMSVGLPPPGLDVMGPMGVAGICTLFALVACIPALVDALYRWRRAVLIARIRAARAGRARSITATRRPDVPWVDRRHGSISGHGIAGRAPPALVAG